MHIIPAPAKVQEHPGTFTIGPDSTVSYDAPEARAIATYLAERLRASTGFRLPLVEGERTGKGIHFALASAGEQGAEAYRLDVSSSGGVVIEAAGGAGLFYGVQTLLQMLPAAVFSGAVVEGQAWDVPCASIEDEPRFGWRGGMLDVSRHFFDKEFVMRYIDLLALHKMNTFHFHITDDQGWRIEIDKYPLLTEVGAWRSETMGDGTPHGGFYTRGDIREIVEYAASRQINVVPEIEMPGHARSVLAGYPELSCTGGPFTVWTEWGISEDVYCAGNEATFEFLTAVLDEVIELFPSEFVHIGGDECPKVRWHECPKCQARMQAEGLQNEHELQSYFIKRIEGHLKSRGRRLVGWSEISEGGLAPSAVVMDWIGGGADAARAGHDAIMSPTTHCYFDYYQSLDRASEPLAIGGFIPLEKVYSFEPVPAGLTPEQQKHILGGQANLWSERSATPAQVEYMVYPRMVAMSEVLWSPAELRNPGDFYNRLHTHLGRLDALDVHYRPLDGTAT